MHHAISNPAQIIYRERERERERIVIGFLDHNIIRELLIENGHNRVLIKEKKKEKTWPLDFNAKSLDPIIPYLYMSSDIVTNSYTN